jgi:hypothetical protein
MGSRDWGREFESMFQQHRRTHGQGDWGRGHGGQWGGWGPPGREYDAATCGWRSWRCSRTAR